MRFEQLKYILDIAETESITLTAEHFSVTRQAVSSSIKQLEEELERKLLLRGNARVCLNSAGEEVAEFAKILLKGEAELHQKLSSIDASQYVGDKRRHTRICSTSAIINAIIPKVIRAIETHSGNSSFTLVASDVKPLLKSIATGECEIGLLTINEEELYHNIGEVNRDEYHVEILGHDELVVCLNRKNYKGEKDSLTTEDLSEYKKSLYSLLPAREYSNMVGDNLLASSNDTDFHRGMLQYNNCIVLMPSLAYEFFFNSKKFVKLSISDLETTIVHAAICRHDADIGVKKTIGIIKKYMYS